MVKNEVINAIAERIEGAKKGDIALILDTYAEIIIDTLKIPQLNKVKCYLTGVSFILLIIL